MVKLVLQNLEEEQERVQKLIDKYGYALCTSSTWMRLASSMCKIFILSFTYGQLKTLSGWYLIMDCQHHKNQVSKVKRHGSHMHS